MGPPELGQRARLGPGGPRRALREGARRAEGSTEQARPSSALKFADPAADGGVLDLERDAPCVERLPRIDLPH